MIKETRQLKPSDLLGLVLMVMKDGKGLYRVKIVSVELAETSFNGIPNYTCEIIRETDGKTAILQSSTMFDRIRTGVVRIEKKG